MRSAVKVLPVPQAMISFPRSVRSKPTRTSSTAFFWWPLTTRRSVARSQPGWRRRRSPIDGHAVEVVDTDALDSNRLVEQGSLRIGRPPVGGPDDDPPRPLLLPGQGQERAELLQRQGARWVVALALDRDEAPFGVTSDKVHADVGAAAPWPVHPPPDLGELLSVGTIGLERVDHQALEAVTLVLLVGGDLAASSIVVRRPRERVGMDGDGEG